MNVPLLDLRAQYETIKDKVKPVIDEIFETQRFVLGAHGTALEEEIAKSCGVPYAIGVASGTDSLLLAMRALGVGPGDAVVTTPFTFFATAGAVVNLGARPIFTDIEPAGFEMDPQALASFLESECVYNPATGKTTHKASGLTVKAILPVHLYGQCADMDVINAIAGARRLPVVEDACQAIGADYKGKKAGALGTLGCFSFFPSKNLGGAGDGGMVVTSDKDLADRVRLLRGHGAHHRYYHDIVGFNSRLDEIQAAVLRVKLPHLESWSRQRAAHAAKYAEAFNAAGLCGDSGKVTPPVTFPGRSHIFHQYVIRCRERDGLQAFLKESGVGCEVYYPVSLHEQACFQDLGYKPDDLPQSHAATQEVLALPVYPELTYAQRDYVVERIRAFYGA
ncbi:MAG: DegT/DnrJ/EryC1/StrS family aminotransferase [Acidobacteriota bacterium]|jgi:dTDP-4-amino-4,6-dideoxygalactose transaminase|nr:DegT/DnrJ/EryC1/StrS family aminotransferase [Acidobacteriota bacterium]